MNGWHVDDAPERGRCLNAVGRDADLPLAHQHRCWIRPARGSHCRFVIGTLAVDRSCCSSRTRRFLPNLPLLYSNTVLQGESRKLLRRVVKKLVSPVTTVTGGEGGILLPPFLAA